MAKVVIENGPGKRELEKLIAQAKEQHVKVGFFESDQYESGQPVAYIAAIMEHGYAGGNLPPRPLFGPTIDRCEGDWKKAAEHLAKQVMAGKLTVTQMLEQLGAVAAGDVAETIAATTEPPLEESTIQNREYKKKKGFPIGDVNKPLQETNLLFESVTHVVGQGSGDDEE